MVRIFFPFFLLFFVGEVVRYNTALARFRDNPGGGFTFLYLPLDRCDLVLFLLFPIYVFQLRVKAVAA